MESCKVLFYNTFTLVWMLCAGWAERYCSDLNGFCSGLMWGGGKREQPAPPFSASIIFTYSAKDRRDATNDHNKNRSKMGSSRGTGKGAYLPASIDIIPG